MALGVVSLGIGTAGCLGPDLDAVIQETLELKRIMASLVRKSEVKKQSD